MIIETERLALRELTMDDLDGLCAILMDAESMKYYPAPYPHEKCVRWIEWNLENYAKYGFGLWAVTLKENGLFLGDCGITMQNIDGEQQPEIGYHINRAYTRRGYATEAARAVRDYAFNTLHLPEIYSYQKYTNVPSQNVAENNGMTRIKQYADPVNEYTTVYRITREEYEGLKR